MDDGQEMRVYQKQTDIYGDTQVDKITVKVDPTRNSMVPVMVLDQRRLGTTSKCCGHSFTTMYERVDDNENVDQWFNVPSFCK